ncbi:phosphoribosylanthranilate isomerase [Limosilactobacillus allomucosae]|uniref:N-(5'-phosphoribosyl)anthranilate isomerase n=1 Tax=Limosilactobacillus allomucosae TaxID=3142938 RepID=A0AAU7C0W7_9LACO
MAGCQIKICGLKRSADIAMVNRYRPDLAGFIVDFPRSHRSITEEQLRSLTSQLDPGIRSVGVFVDAPAEKIIQLLNDGVIDMAQLHGRETDADVRRIQQATHRPVIRAYLIHERQDLIAALNSPADLILLDQGLGSGQPFDWQLVSDVAIKRPFILAGGLNANNLDQAIETLRPNAVDLSSSVETQGIKDPVKVKKAIAIVRRHNLNF